MVLVTGATGMIGNYVVKKLLARGYGVRGLSRSSGGDVADKKAVNRAMDGVGAVVHLAACLDLTLGRDEFFKTNVLGMKNILESARLMKVPTVVNVSSGVVYGGGVMIDEKTPLKKGTVDNYVGSKIEALRLVEKYRKKGQNVINVFPTAVIDVNRKAEMKSRGLIRFVWKVMGGIPGGLMGMFGPRWRRINCVLVEDVANGIILAMEKGGVNEDYILGGVDITIESYLKKMVAIYKRWYCPVRLPGWIAEKMWRVSFEDKCFSIIKAKKEIGYIPTRTRKLFC